MNTYNMWNTLYWIT